MRKKASVNGRRTAHIRGSKSARKAKRMYNKRISKYQFQRSNDQSCPSNQTDINIWAYGPSLQLLNNSYSENTGLAHGDFVLQKMAPGRGESIAGECGGRHGRRWAEIKTTLGARPGLGRSGNNPVHGLGGKKRSKKKKSKSKKQPGGENGSKKAVVDETRLKRLRAEREALEASVRESSEVLRSKTGRRFTAILAEIQADAKDSDRIRSALLCGLTSYPETFKGLYSNNSI